MFFALIIVRWVLWILLDLVEIEVGAGENKGKQNGKKDNVAAEIGGQNQLLKI